MNKNQMNKDTVTVGDLIDYLNQFDRHSTVLQSATELKASGLELYEDAVCLEYFFDLYPEAKA
jgi:hypothetical protein